MSSFLSTKFLKYKGLAAQPPRPIVGDLLCVNCGYNLRGLMTGGNCPECGRQISLTRALEDSLLSGTVAQRRALLVGLTIVAICPVVFALARIGFPVAWSLSRTVGGIEALVVIGLLNNMAWCVGVWLLTPSRLQKNHPRLRWVRRSARFTQPLWPTAAVLWTLALLVFPSTPAGDSLMFWASLCQIVSMLGTIAFGAWMVVLAEDAGLDEASARINLSLWVVPILTVPVSLIPWYLRFFALAFILVLLLPWAWYLVQFSRGIWEMRQHVSWALKLGKFSYDRAQRIRETRQELDEEVAASIRPLPPPTPQPDVPALRSDESPAG
ncbi:MAG: hypothetical protein L0219_07440 [Phycisphaerales bacterium]|nr:hypothetical protein [Phycisphaerales bacterium]